MKQFVNIHSFFSSNEDRTIESLSKMYSNLPLLKEAIDGLTKEWLTDELIKGKKILIKPNWVKHSSVATDEICLRTHDNFTLTTLEVILEKRPSQIILGDAPIQGCRWEKMLSTDFIERVSELSSRYGIEIEIHDFRRVTFDPSKNNPLKERNPMSDYVIFDVGKESWLEPITRKDKKQFRVTNYNPDRLAESHKQGVHKYCITKALFDADVVVSLPKVKTHQKAGITAALKNIVGLNGDKDYLPHHRMGGTGFGGDCYQGKNYLRQWAELAIDFANRRQGKLLYWLGFRTSSVLWKFSFPGKQDNMSAGWYGNDTTWRMVLDLNKIIEFGKGDGTLSNTPQRQFFSLCDGIIGGQGDGPLNPEPLPLGVVSFTNHSGFNDLALATLMGFETEKIPLLLAQKKWLKNKDINLKLNNKQIEINDLSSIAVKTIMPPGWFNYN